MEIKGMSYKMKIETILEEYMKSEEGDILILDPQEEFQAKENCSIFVEENK